jgi:hypothetical protein
MWVFSCVLLSHQLEFLPSRPSRSSPTDTTLPSTQPLATPYWPSTHYWDIFTTHTLPYTYSVLGLQAFFWILEPWGLDMIGCPKTSLSNYHSSLRNNPDERSSLF